MKEFKIFRHDDQGIVAVKNGFSWPALLFAFWWMLYHKLWLIAGLWFAGVMVIGFVEVLVAAGAGVGGLIYSLYITLNPCSACSRSITTD